LSNGYSDWYIWRDGHFDEDGNHHPPNNWRDALTGRSAWEWDAERQQYYLHSFHTKQPDLNWSNSQVREAIKQAMRFWLDLGVDGFRVDAVYWMAKDPLMRDDPPSEDYVEGQDSPYESLRHANSSGWPAVYSHLNELASVLKEEPYQYRARFMITEAYPERHNPVASYMAFYEGVDPQVAAPFNFEGVGLPWRAHHWNRFLKSFHAALRAESPLCVASYAFGNHDKPRLASRIGQDAARSAAVMLMTLPGMAFIYYGEELGMTDVPIPADRVQDPAALGDPARGQGRDPQRTPMQWTDDMHAGFTEAAEPWLPVAADYKTNNVEAQSRDKGSFLSLYRALGKLRRKSPALRYGSMEILDLKQPDVLAYMRTYKDENLLTIINFVDKPLEVGLDLVLGDRLISSISDQHKTTDNNAKRPLRLLPHQAVVYSVSDK
jgi:alpha-glucosidase